ncbi:Homeobox Protein Esx1 [Manis pentadactyla]|nr:Homeobox Protein Esx1 [Manis pentadactyla]
MSMEPRPRCSNYDINYLNMRAGTEREEQPGQCLDWHRCFGKTPKEELSLAGAGGLDVMQAADADLWPSRSLKPLQPMHCGLQFPGFFCFPPSTDVKTTATLVVEAVGDEPPTEPKHGAAAVKHVGARALIRVNEENHEGVRHGGGGGGGLDGGSLDGGDRQDGGGGSSLDGSDSHDGGGGGLDGSDSRSGGGSGSDSRGRDGEGNGGGGGDRDLEAPQQQEEPSPAVAQGLQIPVREERRGRSVFAKWQLQALENTFRRAPYPSLFARNEIAERLNLSEAKIQLSFEHTIALISGNVREVSVNKKGKIGS